MANSVALEVLSKNAQTLPMTSRLLTDMADPQSWTFHGRTEFVQMWLVEMCRFFLLKCGCLMFVIFVPCFFSNKHATDLYNLMVYDTMVSYIIWWFVCVRYLQKLFLRQGRMLEACFRTRFHFGFQPWTVHCHGLQICLDFSGGVRRNWQWRRHHRFMSTFHQWWQ